MDHLRIKLLGEIMDHLSGMQAGDLKKLLDDQKAKDMMPPDEGSPMEEAAESPMEEASEDGKPKGIALEKVSIEASPKDKIDQAIADVGDHESDKMPGEEEMSDDELEEMLRKHLK